MIQASAGQGQVKSGDKYKVLVVEDEDATARHMLMALSRAGFECRHAPDGRVALEALQSAEFHLVLLDLTLPELSGHEVCRHIRQRSMVPIMIVTAQEAFEAQANCFRLGADDFLTKPFTPQFLLLRTLALLRRAYVYNGENFVLQHAKVPHTERPAVDIGATPAGWARCDGCGYMGPSHKFEANSPEGHRVMACPHCLDKTQIAYGLD